MTIRINSNVFFEETWELEEPAAETERIPNIEDMDLPLNGEPVFFKCPLYEDANHPFTVFIIEDSDIESNFVHCMEMNGAALIKVNEAYEGETFVHVRKRTDVDEYDPFQFEEDFQWFKCHWKDEENSDGDRDGDPVSVPALIKEDSTIVSRNPNIWDGYGIVTATLQIGAATNLFSKIQFENEKRWKEEAYKALNKYEYDHDTEKAFAKRIVKHFDRE